MKNIHIIPTDKPSRLGYLTKKGKEVFKDLRLFEKPMPVISDSENQNIYITSDEKIKEGVNQWYLDKVLNEPYNSGGAQYSSKQDVIIMTTDSDLIKDGVQKIDDEFLEWFVKNPSCKKVEVETFEVEDYVGFAGHTSYPTFHNEYKIIIPKEEPKQEALEEASERIVKSKVGLHYFGNENSLENLAKKEYIIEGAKWQQEKMYSEEEVYNIVQKAIQENRSKQLHFFDGGYSNPIYNNLKKWFEQFKKK